MILAVDVQYSRDKAVAGGVEFEHWTDARPLREHISFIKGVAEYRPGQFYRRELPCILKLLSDDHLRPTCIVVDGYVFLDGASAPGLGKWLFDALHGRVVVIGVAKNRFKGIPSECQVYRGRSKSLSSSQRLGSIWERQKGIFWS